MKTLERMHGGALLLQDLEPKRLIGTVMSVATETGEDSIHLAFINDSSALAATDDGRETKLTLTRSVALSLVALLRIALAEFAILREQPGGVSRANLTNDIAVKAEASRNSVVVRWASGSALVHWRKVEELGQAHLVLRADIAAAIEGALVTSLATLAARGSSS